LTDEFCKNEAKKNHKIRELEERLLAVRKEVDEDIRKVEDEKNVEIARHVREIKELQATNEYLLAGKEELEKYFATATHELTTRNEQIEYLEGELGKSRTEIERKDKEKADLADKITELETEKDTLNRLEKENGELKFEISSLKGRNSELNDSCLKQYYENASLIEIINELRAENEALTKELAFRSARPSFSSIHSSESRPPSQATFYVKEIEANKDDPHRCKECGQLKGNLHSAFGDPRHYGLPTTPDGSHSEKEGKSRRQSMSSSRGRGRSQSSRKSVIGYFEYSSDSNKSKSRKSTGDVESDILSSPAGSMYGSFYEEPENLDCLNPNHIKLEVKLKESHEEENTELARRIDELNKKTANIEQLEKELKKQLISEAKSVDKDTNPISKLDYLRKNLEGLSYEHENLELIEGDTSPSEENSEKNLPETTPTIIVSGEPTEENVLPFKKEE
ncbi:14217_t:CDS:2, partial [Gigaspora margarita]